MVFHLINFKSGTLLKSADEQSYATVRLGEYYRFDTAEVDATTLANSSKYMVELSEEDQEEDDDDDFGGLKSPKKNPDRESTTPADPALNDSEANTR